MTDFSSFWSGFHEAPMLYIYWTAAIVASLLFVLQVGLLVLGFDADHDFSGSDASFDIDGISFISIKTVACFVLGYGWTGVVFYHSVPNPIWLALLAFGVGLIFMCLIALLLRQVLRLSQNNTFHVSRTIDCVAEVYLRLPPHSQHTGKISVSVDGSVHELLALNPTAEAIPTGARVRITAVIDNDTVQVEPH